MNFTIILLQSFSSTSILILFYFQWEIQFLFTFAFCLFYFVPDNYTNTERPAHIALQLDGSTQDHWIWWVALQSDGELVDVSARPFLVIFECQSCLQEGHRGECQGTTAEVSQLASICLKVIWKVFVESISKHRKNKAIVSSQHRFEKGKSHLSNFAGGQGESRECCIHLKFSTASDTSPVTSSQMSWQTTGQIRVQWHGLKINNDRINRVVIGGTKLNWRSVTSGATQGAILDLILFNNFFNDLDDGAECVLSKSANNTELKWESDTPEDCAARIMESIWNLASRLREVILPSTQHCWDASGVLGPLLCSPVQDMDLEEWVQHGATEMMQILEHEYLNHIYCHQ